jgi:hypothetical protein
VAHAALAGIHRSVDFFNIVFFAVVLSTAPRPATGRIARLLRQALARDRRQPDSPRDDPREQQIVEHLRIRRGQPGGV